MLILPEKIKKQLETPCIVVDQQQLVCNIAKLQNIANEHNCSLRPHIKTHKSVEIARMQIDAGACGITCAKVTEAEVMAENGIEDIFIAYPLVGEHKLKRALFLYHKVKRLILAVDSIDCARAMSEFAQKENVVFEVRMEVDTGAKRTGITPDKLEPYAKEIKKLKGIQVTGIYTFKSLIYHNAPTTDNNLAGLEEGKLLAEIAGKLNLLGFEVKDISAGSTPTGESCAKTGLVTEIRPGTYVFYDQMTYMEKACGFNEIAAAVYATVVSVPDPSYAVIDAGTKTFSCDVRLQEPMFYYEGFAYIPDREDLILDRMNEEHGIIRTTKKEIQLKVGDIIPIIPVHICTAINLQNEIFLYSNEDVTLRKIKVDARGMLV
jgi:D-serine deaminase-like pyridoxal phosphate-dependent protein